MKKFIFLLIFLAFGVACENETELPKEPEVEASVSDSIKTYQGSYISVKDEAVLNGDNFVFQVKMDSMAKVLENKIKGKELLDQNVVPVKIKGKVIQNPGNKGYSKMIEITEIIAIETENNTEN